MDASVLLLGAVLVHVLPARPHEQPFSHQPAHRCCGFRGVDLNVRAIPRLVRQPLAEQELRWPEARLIR